MDKVKVENLANASFESNLIFWANCAYDDVMGRIVSASLFCNGLKADCEEIYEMETAKVVLERTLEKVNKKLNAMYNAYTKEGK